MAGDTFYCVHEVVSFDRIQFDAVAGMVRVVSAAETVLPIGPKTYHAARLVACDKCELA